MTPVAATIRPVTPRELPTVVSSLADWHVTNGPCTLQQTFPQVYRPDGQATRIGLFEEDQLLSHAALQRVSLAGPEGDIHAGLIGAVATAPEARGQGLASRLLSEVIAWGRELGLDALLLWAERWSLYERLGFRPAGRQEEVLVRSPDSKKRPPRGRPAGVRDVAAIHRLHEAKPYRVRRELQDTVLLLSVAGMTTHVLERDGEVVAYACCGKGADFPGWWHEMGGTDGNVADLLQGSMAALDQDCTMLLLPPYRAGLKHILAHAVLRARHTPCALRLALTAAGRRDFFIDGLDSI